MPGSCAISLESAAVSYISVSRVRRLSSHLLRSMHVKIAICNTNLCYVIAFLSRMLYSF